MASPSSALKVAKDTASSQSRRIATISTLSLTNYRTGWQVYKPGCFAQELSNTKQRVNNLSTISHHYQDHAVTVS
eukprot:3475834-Amphidinium_carterae.1